MLKETNTAKVMFLILLLAFLVRLVAFLYFPDLQTWEYEEIARNLAAGHGFKNIYLNTTYYSCTTPLFPYICSVIYRLFGINHNAVVLLQVVIALFTCIIIFDLGRRIANKTVGLLSSFLYAVHPGLAIYSVTKVHPLIFDAFFLSSTLWAFMYLKESLNFKRSFLLGIVVGLCILTRSTVMAFLPFGFIWLLFENRDKGKLTFAHMAIIFVSLLLIVSPWTLRNFAVHKKLILTTSADAEVFWRGNNKNATGTTHTLSGKPILTIDKAFYNRIVSRDELGQRELFREEAVRFIKENPEKTIQLFFKKLYYFWWFSPATGILYPHLYLISYKCLYAFFVLFAIFGLFSILRGRIKISLPNFILLVLFLISISMFQSFFYVEGRHRWGIEPVFLIVSAIGIIGLFQNKIKGGIKK